ncbi:hypothetical protein GCM10007304_47520 [Rhodococcoides trifolii]|uniref:DUF7159 domain-containing protein n=1 Tax=Rhodococcoides trifolii TaxID=908250 RepID=A0A917LIU8_9NOCA|nr:acetate and sugar kinases/Hsc70/actin family protein [Rhodococcus trifolii]GGG28190.1 hypothetical protein GCM10007304_47520 [Rhodococcus trifolii]
MTAVFGLSIGATSIRVARADGLQIDPPADGSPQPEVRWTYVTRRVPRSDETHLDEAAEEVSTARSQNGSDTPIGVAVVRPELRLEADERIAERLDGVLIAAESRAALRSIVHSAMAAQYDTVAIYDLGATGLSVSLVDTERGVELGAARSTLASGDLFDHEVRQHLISNGILSEPTTPEQQAEVIAFCRGVKESLSTSVLAQTPGGGTMLMSRNQFDQAIYLPIEETAKIVSELGLRCRRAAQAVIVIGGGAHIPVVMTILARWLNVPVLVPENPEMVVAHGAALLAAEEAALPAPAVASAGAASASAAADSGFTTALVADAGDASGSTFYAIAVPETVVPPSAGEAVTTTVGPSPGRSRSWLDRLLGRLPTGAGVIATFVAIALVGLWAAGQSLLRPSENGDGSDASTSVGETSATAAPSSLDASPSSPPAETTMSPTSAVVSSAVVSSAVATGRRNQTVEPTRTRAPYTYPTNDHVSGSIPSPGASTPRPDPSLDISVPFQIPPLRLPIPRVYLPGF